MKFYDFQTDENQKYKENDRNRTIECMQGQFFYGQVLADVMFENFQVIYGTCRASAKENPFFSKSSLIPSSHKVTNKSVFLWDHRCKKNPDLIESMKKESLHL